MTGRLVLQALDALVKGEAAVARAQQARPPLETHALDAANAQLRGRPRPGPPMAGRLGAPSGDGRDRGALGSQEEAGLMGGSHRLAAGRPRLFNREDGPAGRIARRAWAMVTAEYDVGRPLARELAARVLAAAMKDRNTKPPLVSRPRDFPWPFSRISSRNPVIPFNSVRAVMVYRSWAATL